MTHADDASFSTPFTLSSLFTPSALRLLAPVALNAWRRPRGVRLSYGRGYLGGRRERTAKSLGVDVEIFSGHCGFEVAFRARLLIVGVFPEEAPPVRPIAPAQSRTDAQE